jgi:phosphoglycolate phosphatase
MKIDTVIFDLDGTLIDSAPSILSSIKASFEEVGIKPAQPLTSNLVGPPVGLLFKSLLSDKNMKELPLLIEVFKRHYDELGYLETLVYKGVSEMLQKLNQMQFRLYIATNKRIHPARKIIKHLGWTELFTELYALDYCSPAFPHKAAMVKELLEKTSRKGSKAIYIGDRNEDVDAALASDIPIIMAAWGYEDCIHRGTNIVIARIPGEVVQIIGAFNLEGQGCLCS